jgi:type I restriction enzyme S subunit
MSISLDRLATVPVEFPPLAEQDGIVKLLDEGEGLRNLRADADGRTANLQPALFHKMFGQYINASPIDISVPDLQPPPGWQWARLTEMAQLATGHTPSRRHPEWWGGEIPWISLADIRQLDGSIATTTNEYVNEEGIANSSSVKLPKGTVCLSRTASVGFVTVMGREMATSQDFVNWICGPTLEPIFLMGALMQAREHLRSLASGSIHKTIYFPTVKQFALIVPPLPLQKDFADRVTEIRELEGQQSASRRRLDWLFQSMLHNAFAGAR